MLTPPNGRHIISGSSDHTIRIWDAETGAPVGNPLKGHTGWVQSVAYSPDGKRVISGSNDHTIRIRDAETGASVGNPLNGHIDYVQSVAYSPDGQHIISGSDDRTIRIWDAEANPEAGKSHYGNTYPVQSIRHSSDGQHTLYDNTAPVSDAFPLASIRRSSCNLMHPDFYAMPDINGWVKGSEGGLLYWVPRDCRPGLHSPALLTIPLTSHSRSVSLNFDNFPFGTLWTQIYKSVRS